MTLCLKSFEAILGQVADAVCARDRGLVHGVLTEARVAQDNAKIYAALMGRIPKTEISVEDAAKYLATLVSEASGFQFFKANPWAFAYAAFLKPPFYRTFNKFDVPYSVYVIPKGKTRVCCYQTETGDERTTEFPAKLQLGLYDGKKYKPMKGLSDKGLITVSDEAARKLVEQRTPLETPYVLLRPADVVPPDRGAVQVYKKKIFQYRLPGLDTCI